MPATPFTRPWSLQVPGFEILGPIGSGGMGEVYQARQLALGRTVALKWLRDDGRAQCDRNIERFRREAELMAKVHHPNILTIHDCGIADGRPYLVMEYIDSGDLRRLMSSGVPVATRTVRDLMRPICNAVACLHRNGILHRDLKPENILIAEDGQPKVTDFGIAVLRECVGSITQTMQGLGTPGYVAPEQQFNLGIDERVDQYSLAALSYELLTGVKPLGLFKAPSQHNPGLSTAVDEVILRGMNENPTDRFPCVGDFAAALDDALAAPSSAPSEGPSKATPEAPPRKKRRLVRRLVLALVLLILVGQALKKKEPGKAIPPAVPPSAVDPEVSDGVGGPLAQPPVVDEHLIELQAYLYWLESGAPDGEEGVRARTINWDRAVKSVPGDLQRLAHEVWKSRGSPETEDPDEALRGQERDWAEALRLLEEHLHSRIGEVEPQVIPREPSAEINRQGSGPEVQTIESPRPETDATTTTTTNEPIEPIPAEPNGPRR